MASLTFATLMHIQATETKKSPGAEAKVTTRVAAAPAAEVAAVPSAEVAAEPTTVTLDAEQGTQIREMPEAVYEVSDSEEDIPGLMEEPEDDPPPTLPHTPFWESTPNAPDWGQLFGKHVLPKVKELGRPIRISLPCVGVDGCTTALEAIGVPFQPVNVYDLVSEYGETLEAHYKEAGVEMEVYTPHLGPEKGDITKMINSDIEASDGIVAGPPCIPFAGNGNHEGEKDQRFQPFLAVLTLIVCLAKNAASCSLCSRMCLARCNGSAAWRPSSSACGWSFLRRFPNSTGGLTNSMRNTSSWVRLAAAHSSKAFAMNASPSHMCLHRSLLWAWVK